MYAHSTAFEEAVRNNANQLCILEFKDGFLSNEDICMDTGVQLHDLFCSKDDLGVGQAVSNELDFSIFNDKHLLDDYDFGEMFATIGVMTKSIRRVATEKAYMETPLYNKYESTSDSLLKNNAPCPVQPNFDIGVLIYKDGYVTVVSDDFTQAIKFMDNNTPVAEQVPVLPFMSDKLSRLANCGFSYESNTLKCWVGSYVDTYEFVPLGRFIADRPNVSDVIRISFECMDFMSKFEKDISEVSISYPTTYYGLLNTICNHVGVEHIVPDNFINSDCVLEKKPDAFDNATMRNVLAWLAESAGCVAKFNRDGKLSFYWLTQTERSYDENDYTEFNPYWYKAKPTTKIYNRDTTNGTETVRGNGEEGYLIQDNPLLKGAD